MEHSPIHPTRVPVGNRADLPAMTPGRVPRKKEKRTNRQTRVLAEHLRLQEKLATVI